MGLSIKEANRYFENGEYRKACDIYEEVSRLYPELSEYLSFNISLCRGKIKNSCDDLNENDIFITLTTISERLDLLPPVLESLHNQILRPKKIFLNISTNPYLLDKGIVKDDPRILNIEKMPLVEINWVENTGPYRKIVPFLQKFFGEKSVADRIFITVDDDTLYPDFFVKQLYEKYLEYDAIIAFRGRYITFTDQGIKPYSEWKLGRNELSMNNLPTGKDGIIYSTKFFTKDFLDKAAFDLAPTADDLWIKWHCGLNGVKAVILNPEASTSDYKSFPVVDYSPAYRDVSLFKAHNSSQAGGKNDVATQKLEKFFFEKYGYNLNSLCEKEVL